MPVLSGDPLLETELALPAYIDWGTFEQNHAVGLSAAGVLAHNVFTEGDRVSISGGIGWGVQEHNLGGRVGLQMSW